MRVRKRGSKWYYTFDMYQNGNRKKIERLGGATKKEALEKGIQEEANYLKTNVVYDHSIKLHALIDLYEKNYLELKLKKYTVKNLKLLLKTVKKHLGNMRIRDIKPLHIQEFILNMHEEGRSANNYKKSLQGLFKYGVKMDLIQKSPVSDISVPTKVAKKKEIISNEDVRLIMDSRLATKRLIIGDYRNDQVKDLFLLLYLTGLRLGESLALKFEDVDFVKKEMNITRTADKEIKNLFDSPKTKGSIRKIAVNDTLIELILRRKSEVERLRDVSEGDMGIDLVFQDVDGQTILHGTLRRYAKKIGQIINKRFTYHGLRHSHTTELMQAGVPLKLIQDRLGHSDISTTLQIYTSVTPDMQNQAREVIDGLYEYEKN